MDILSLALLLLFIVAIGLGAYWLINKFFPAGLPRTIALAVVGLVLLIVLLNGAGLLGGTAAILSTPVGT